MMTRVMGSFGHLRMDEGGVGVSRCQSVTLQLFEAIVDDRDGDEYGGRCGHIAEPKAYRQGLLFRHRPAFS